MAEKEWVQGMKRSKIDRLRYNLFLKMSCNNFIRLLLQQRFPNFIKLTFKEQDFIEHKIFRIVFMLYKVYRQENKTNPKLLEKVRNGVEKPDKNILNSVQSVISQYRTDIKSYNKIVTK